MSLVRRHPFHIVDPSPWPLTTAFGAFCLTAGSVMYMHAYTGGGTIALIGLATILYSMYTWCRDIVRESTFQGNHTMAVQTGIRYGMLLFILSEVVFFAAFFWGFFHSSLSPTIEIGAVWPPKGIETLNPWEVPFLNTVILLLSGATVTWSHHAMIHGNRTQSILGLVFTVILAITFTGFQVFEYMDASFRISDGIYGTTFYMSTGFHGFHVFVGTCFLAVCLIREIKHHFTTKHHVGFEAAAWYWHFVDVVWLFLFVSIYWWGGA
uniref:Cytochrome c oxidase subunit 3 n=1 Tax=Seculamonas ecuadoriensis TaxID=221724 RepID=M4QMB7_SECEC|nr:cytochrome c oxidase subunit III [Seculamonas ecuadoriensis]AGH24503.1 cytochrome c oxidase subunit 3 [Seculamonas ecuadoriensis]